MCTLERNGTIQNAEDATTHLLSACVYPTPTPLCHLSADGDQGDDAAAAAAPAADGKEKKKKKSKKDLDGLFAALGGDEGAAAAAAGATEAAEVSTQGGGCPCARCILCLGWACAHPGHARIGRQLPFLPTSADTECLHSCRTCTHSGFGSLGTPLPELSFNFCPAHGGWQRSGRQAPSKPHTLCPALPVE